MLYVPTFIVALFHKQRHPRILVLPVQIDSIRSLLKRTAAADAYRASLPAFDARHAVPAI